MKTLENFLSELAHQDVKLWVEDGRLRCNAPEGVLTSDIRTQLTERKQEIITFLQQTNLETDNKQPPLTPIERNGKGLPLSFAQQRLWVLEKLGTVSNAYNMPLTLDLRGELELGALKQSLNQIIIRHEPLRTLFKEINGTPIQVIQSPYKLPLPEVDLRGLAPSQQKAEIQQLLQEENQQHFKIEKEPPIRAKLFKLGEKENILLVTLHHIASDGWSVSVFSKELSACYQAVVTRQSSPLPELPVQYVDFAVWQRNWLQGSVLETQLDYWKEKLKELPQLQLPTDYPRPATETFRGGEQIFSLSAPLTEKLNKISQHQSVTLFMTLLAAFKVLLYRYTGQEKIVVGSPIANRNRRELEGLIGFFVNSLVMYTDLSGEPSFLEVLNRVRQTALEAYAHQDLPFEKLVEELQPERSLKHNPLFQVMFAVQQTEALMSSFSLPNLEMSLYPVAEVEMTVRMDLELHLWPEGEELKILCAYNRDLFEAETIQRMLSHYQVLLSAVVENLDLPIGQLPLMTEAELEGILVEWNKTTTNYPTDRCIHQLFEKVVEKFPEAVALIYNKDEQLTYSQLNQKANQLAHHLLSLGITPETPIGIYIDPTLERITGLLGILKAGGAYVAIDPTEKSQDWQSISVILTQNHLKSKITDSNAKIICLDTEWESIVKQKTDNPDIATTPTNLAYILNQTLVEHQAVVQRLQWLQEILKVTNQDILLHKTSLTQDVALLEIGLPLISGSSIVIAANDKPTELQKLISQHKVSIVHLYPSELPTWLNINNQAASLKSWRSLLCSGETLSTEVADQFLQTYPVSLHNSYSIPEAAGEISHWKWLEKPTGENVPVGNPGRLSVYLLDKHQNPVPKGVPGEIHVGCESLATDAVEIIEHPQLGRLFPTGDIGRYHNQGYLEIVGTKHRQTWIKGKRVKLTDIESVLLSFPGVEQAYVLAHQTLLVAYVVVSGVWNPKQLNSQMQEQLAPEMIPVAVVPLSSLPLTNKGKIDEVALKGFQVIDDNLVERWETELKAVPEIEQVAVVVQKKNLQLLPLHISDLLPSDLVPGIILTEPLTPPTNPTNQPEDKVPEKSDSKPLAFSDGGLLTIPEDAPKTLTEALIKTATEFKERQITYILAEGKEDFQTYGCLLQEAKSILSGLSEIGLAAGSRAILQIKSLRDYFPILWACILGGITPVTVAVPSTYDPRNSVVKKLYKTWELLEEPPILATDSLREQLEGLKNFLPMSNLKVVSVSGLRNYPATAEIHKSHPEDVAFFQLTSGSTGAPKCIQETHKGIITHIHAAQQFNGYSESDICLNWLPVDHVVPILTTHLKDTYLGCQQIEAATDVILANPLTWLDLIEKYHVTQTWAPNFGFKLVSDSLLKVAGKSWDLSSIKFLMNAGEQVTLPVVREFLNLVAPYGIRPQAMQPAFGMAEVCTCMTYQNEFTPETGVHRVEKSSLGGKLQITQDDDRDTIDFIDLGKPVPGVKIRITDRNNQVIPEGAIGRFQIKGAVVTPGYLNNVKANEEAFVGDGWFNSGDLGFIIDGHLILTGREKEQIVINGVNYYCYEIEEIVNQIEGVEPTYVGACGLISEEKGTEKLAIFFTPQNSSEEIDIELIKKIKGQVSANIGINADYVLPLEREDFPKTTSGKIQRSLMKKMLARGDFDEVIKELDVKEGNSNTIPDWFYEKIWRRKKGNYHLQKLSKLGVILVFLDELGLGQDICQKLEKNYLPYVQIELGETFKKVNENSYIISPDVREDYQKLSASLAAENIQIGTIIHLWHYDKYGGERTEIETLETAQKTGIYSLLFILQTFGNQRENNPVRLLYVASESQCLNQKEAIAYEKATVSGLLKTIPQEVPHWDCRHLDLPQESLEVNSARILE